MRCSNISQLFFDYNLKWENVEMVSKSEYLFGCIIGFEKLCSIRDFSWKFYSLFKDIDQMRKYRQNT